MLSTTLLTAIAALTLFSSVVSADYSPQYQPCTASFTPFTRYGCFDDANLVQLPFNPMALPLDGQAMTVEICQAACKSNGFRFAGIEYCGQCRCGSTITSTQLDDSRCQYACTGDSTELCGGWQALTVYIDPTYVWPIPAPSDCVNNYVSLGCYSDVSGRALNMPQDDMSLANPAIVTPELCLARCALLGAAYAAVENGVECSCGGSLAPLSAPIDSSMCNMPCSALPSTVTQEICGGTHALNLYYNSGLDTCEPCKGTGPIVPANPVPSVVTATVVTVATTTATATATVASITTATATTTATTTATVTQLTTVLPPTPPQASQPGTCERKCGAYCQPPLPNFTNPIGCKQAASQCWSSLKDCFKYAGPGADLLCAPIGVKCALYGSFCAGTKCSVFGCNKKDCDNGWNIPSRGKPSPTCKPVKPTPTPTPTNNLCIIPAGYQTPVGGYAAPNVACNDVQNDFQSGNCFKLFSFQKTKRCASYQRSGLSSACQNACQIQYDNCKNQYATTCTRGFRLARRNPNALPAVDGSEDLEKRTFGLFDSLFGNLFGRPPTGSNGSGSSTSGGSFWAGLLSWFGSSKGSWVRGVSSGKWVYPWLNGGSSDSYNSAVNKCYAQKMACVKANTLIRSNSCSAFGSR